MTLRLRLLRVQGAHLADAERDVMGAVTVPGAPAGSIIADEIGLETGFHGAYRLKSFYQPVFRVSGESLEPEALDACAKPMLDGQPVETEMFLLSVAPERERQVRTLCSLLHIGNCHQMREDGLSLHLGFETERQSDADAMSHLAFMLARLAQTGVAPQALVCGFRAAPDPLTEVSERLLETMRSSGVRLSVDGFGPGQSALERVEKLRPEIVKIDGGWFRRIAPVAPARRLLAKLVEGLKRQGASVLVKGVETPSQLEAALDAGADLVQGDLLARRAMAGSVQELGLLEIDRFFRDPEKVVVSLR